MKLTESEPCLLTARQAADLLGVSPRTVTSLGAKGDLPAVKLGSRGRWRVIRRGVDEIVRAEPTQSRYFIRGVEPEREPSSPKEFE